MRRVFQFGQPGDLQFTARLQDIQRRRIALVQHGLQDHAPLLQREPAPSRPAVRRGLHRQQLGRKADEVAVKVMGLRRLHEDHRAFVRSRCGSRGSVCNTRS